MKWSFRAVKSGPFALAAGVALWACTLTPAEAKTARIRDLADTVAANPILTKFAAMIRASDLETFLSSRGPFTLFAPTDSAFAKLPPGALEALLRPENKERLQDILLLHVVNGKRLGAKDLLPLKTVLSCQGTLLPIKTSRSGSQAVMKAKIVHADIRCQNGIINEIDTLLMPPDAALPALITPAPPSPAGAAPPIGERAATNAASPQTNTAASDTNAAPVVPVAPVASP
jgi:uncharacterized surface protein with fasciclin (FAS1) repeats